MNKIKYDSYPKTNKPVIVEGKITYAQEGDCCSGNSDDIQHLTIELANGGIEDTDVFLVISTDRWAINNVKEIEYLIKDFNERMFLKEQSDIIDNKKISNI